MKPQVLVSGSIAYDLIMNYQGQFKNDILPDKVHVLNVGFLISNIKQSFGGTAGNIVYSLSLLGENPKLIGHVGSDYGDYKKWFQQNKINTSLVKQIKKHRTAIAHIITDQDDNQITGFYPGALSQPYKLSSKQAGKAELAIAAPDNPISMLNYIKVYKQKKIKYIFDPGQNVTTFSGAQLRQAINGAHILIANDYEMSLVAKKTGWNQSQLKKKVDILIITLGGQGSIIHQGNKKIVIPPAKPKNISDPTGAGDAYRAGLIKGLIEGWPLEKACRFAGLVAVYTVEKYGTQTHKFTWSGLKKRYRQNFGETL